MSADGNTPVLAEDRMRELGFTDHNPKHWYYCARVGSAETINITINKTTGGYEELVMDEYFGQPAYRGIMREPYRTDIRAAVDREVAKLQAAGLTVAVDHSLYGYADE